MFAVFATDLPDRDRVAKRSTQCCLSGDLGITGHNNSNLDEPSGDLTLELSVHTACVACKLS